MTSVAQPDRKRPRVEEADDAGSQGASNSKHPTLYFEDGNVVLRCRGTDFRVHNTLLSRNSPVFRDLFAARKLDTTPDHPGCITVSLDDDARDTGVLLHSIYDGFFIRVSKLTADTFPSIASLLRSSTKYEIQPTRDAIVELFRQEWPATLELYDRKMTTHADQASKVNPAAAIALLSGCGYSSPDLLRPLFYELTTRSWKVGDPASANHLAPLSITDMQIFLVGLNALRNLQARLAICPLNDVPHESCRAYLSFVWCYTVCPILANSKDEMCHPLRDWKQVIGLFSVENNSNDAAPDLPNHVPPPAPPPSYQHPQLAYQLVPQNPHQNPVHLQEVAAQYQRHPQRAAYTNLHSSYHAGSGSVQAGASQVTPPWSSLIAHARAAPSVSTQHIQSGPAHPTPHPAPSPPTQPNPKLCSPCTQALLAHLSACRQRIWDTIPTLFNFA